MERSRFRLLAFVITLAIVNFALAGNYFFLRSRPPVRRSCPETPVGVPKRAYQKSEARVQQSVLGTIGADQPVEVELPTADAESEADPEVEDQQIPTVRRKYFRLQSSKIAAGNLKLERISVFIDDDGQVHATGLLSHDGGLHSELEGGKAVIRLRVFGGIRGIRNPLTDASVLHEFRKEMWVVANTAESLPLADVGSTTAVGPAEAADLRAENAGVHTPERVREFIASQFDSLSHVEVVLEHIQDR
ncbi:MAG: hypothetical protein KDB27_31725 [Planctomycetales bacterium]|nr:hypothetical protein [Planctomycetales bacterium]